MLVDRKRVYSGRIVDLLVDTVEIDGRKYVREVVRHPGGVVILAQLEDGRIPFVRQQRYPLGARLLELPAGKLDPGEEPEAAALRELEEEAGFRSEGLEHVFSYYPTPGFCDELLHFYYTNRLRQTEPSREPDEKMCLELYSLGEAIEMLERGEIGDGKTLLGLLWLARRLNR